MPALVPGLSIADAVRFRDDDPVLFGVEVGDGMGDDAYVAGLRDHLRNSVELVTDLFPELARCIEQVQHDLLPHEEIRGFISSDPTPQAWCMGGRDGHTTVIGITSGLIELMDPDELKFVIGHEIGHYVMGHHRRQPPDDDGVETVNYRSLQRMAEISADRVGFLASPSSEAAFRAILKTASGLGSRHVRFDVDAFSAQFQRLKELQKGGQDATSTHPLFSVRCRALTLFAASEPFFAATGRRGSWTHSRADLDDQIAADLLDSSGYHPVVELEKAVRINLVWLALRLFVEDGRFTKSEQAFLKDNFDRDLAERAIDFVRSHGPVAVCRKFEEALDALAEMKEGARESACTVIRRVASVAGGEKKARLKVLQQVHRHLKIRAKVRIEPWADEHSVTGMLELG